MDQRCVQMLQDNRWEAIIFPGEFSENREEGKQTLSWEDEDK